MNSSITTIKKFMALLVSFCTVLPFQNCGVVAYRITAENSVQPEVPSSKVLCADSKIACETPSAFGELACEEKNNQLLYGSCLERQCKDGFELNAASGVCKGAACELGSTRAVSLFDRSGVRTGQAVQDCIESLGESIWGPYSKYSCLDGYFADATLGNCVPKQSDFSVAIRDQKVDHFRASPYKSYIFHMHHTKNYTYYRPSTILNILPTGGDCAARGMIDKPLGFEFSRGKNLWNYSSYYVDLLAGCDVEFQLRLQDESKIGALTGQPIPNDPGLVKHSVWMQPMCTPHEFSSYFQELCPAGSTRICNAEGTSYYCHNDAEAMPGRQ